MGNLQCSKCGVDMEYYNKQGYVNYDRPSCRKSENRERPGLNGKHEWTYYLCCIPINFI